MFYVYREVLFDKLICKVEILNTPDGIKTLMCGGGYRRAVRPDHEYLEDFPHGINLSLRDKQAVLVYLAGEDATAWFKNITNHFLKGKWIPLTASKF